MRDELLQKMRETAQRIQQRINELLAKYGKEPAEGKQPLPDEKAD